MTSGLGDFIIMGDLIKKVEALLPQARCLIAHRGNPHVWLWAYDHSEKRFFDVYKTGEILKLVLVLREARKKGFTVFCLQMAPGSVQGFLFYLFLKVIKAIDFIVDFNLINADIITPPRGSYILDLHLNQINDLLGIEIPSHFYCLRLPIKHIPEEKAYGSHKKIGIHPWSRRGHLPCFVWPFEKWAEVIRFLLGTNKEIIVFGKDARFLEFKSYLRARFGTPKQLKFIFCNSVEKLIKVVDYMDLIISVNTAVIHIGYALEKKMIILSGPSLDIWIPKGEKILTIKENAPLQAADKCIKDKRFRSVERIKTNKVIDAIEQLLYQY